MILKIAAVTVAVATLGACSSAPRAMTFDSSKSALLVLATPVRGSINTDEFRRVDLASNEFVEGGYVRMEVNTFGGFNALADENNQINQKNAGKRRVALAVREISPGDYARQQSGRTSGSANYGFVGSRCLSELAPVYSLAAGEVAIVRVDDVAIATGFMEATWRSPADAPSDDEVMQEFEGARTDYPGIVGTAAIKRPTAFIRWPEGRDACKIGKKFDRVATPPKVDVAPAR